MRGNDDSNHCEKCDKHLDPTERVSRKLSEKLLTLKRSGYLSDAVYNKIRSRHKQPPRICGLPKILKADVPLRPIVSCVNTFAYDFSAYLANILSPLTGKLEYTVTNSARFVSTVSSETILHNEIIVSFDVVAVYQRSHRRRCTSSTAET